MVGPRLTKKQRLDIYADVESVMMAGAFSEKAALRIAGEYGCTGANVWHYRRKVIKAWTLDQSKLDMEAERADMLQRIRHSAAVAQSKGAFGAVRGLYALETDILGLRTPRVIEARLQGPDGGPIQVQAVISQIVQKFADDIRGMPTEQLVAAFGSGNGNGNGHKGNGRGHVIDARGPNPAGHLEEDPDAAPRRRRGSGKGSGGPAGGDGDG